MKKITFSLFTFCLLFSVFTLQAQPHQLPDGSFETGWQEKGGHYGPYTEYETEFLYTLNSLYAIKNDGGAADITAHKDGTNAQHGQNSIRLVSGAVPVGTDVFLPGMVGTINQEFVKEFLGSPTGAVTMTRDWDYDTPHFLEGWYKYNPVGGDSALIDIGFFTYGEGFVSKIILKETVNSWTKFTVSIPPQYWGETFKDIRVLFVASAGVNFDKLMECKGQKKSTLWVDNVKLIYGNGITQDLTATLKAKAFPNPAAEVLNIELNENFVGTASVYNMSGSLVMESNVNGNQCQLNTSALASGNYIYKLMNGNTIFAQGKFVIAK